MRTVLICGLGLMGGSLAAALRGTPWRVLLHHRRPEVAQQAQALGYGTALSELSPAALRPHHSIDAAVVCTPVGTIPGLARQLAAAMPGVITDVGSTKASIVTELADLDAAGRFVGSHPMCGSHRTGLEAADAELYRDRTVVLTPTAATPAGAQAIIADLWRAAGAQLAVLDPSAHDRAVASASHLPHVLAVLAAATLTPEGAPLAASGFRDTTRIAAGDPGLWTDILLSNRDEIATLAGEAAERLLALRRALTAGDAAAVRAFLDAGRDGRRRFQRLRGDGAIPADES